MEVFNCLFTWQIVCLPKAEVLNQTVNLAGMGPLYSVRTVWVGQNETSHNSAIHSFLGAAIHPILHTQDGIRHTMIGAALHESRAIAKRVDGPGKAGA